MGNEEGCVQRFPMQRRIYKKDRLIRVDKQDLDSGR